MNTYTGISDCYDLLMRAGYYDHDGMAKAATAVMGERTSVLELGVGTGMFAESLARVSPDCEITGVDFTPSMLEIAQERVGEDAELIEADVTAMDLGRAFDTAISSGGVWVIIRDEGEYMLGTHLYDYDSEVKGLENVTAHLEPDGLVLLSIQDMHRDFEQELEDEVVYAQHVSRDDHPDEDHFTIKKEYSFTRDADVLAAQTLELGFYRRNLMDRIVDEAGLAFEEIDGDDRFFVFRRDGETTAA